MWLEIQIRKPPLEQAMKAMLTVRRPTGMPDLDVALGWHIRTCSNREIVWHSGGTGGFRSFMSYDASTCLGIVVLSNTFTTVGVDDIALHLLDPTSLT